MKTCFTLAVWAAALCIGCGGGAQSKTSGNQATAPPGPKATAPPGSGHVGNTNKPKPKKGKLVEVKPGVTRREKGVGDGVYATPIKALWRTEERMQLHQLEKAMKYYRAEHDGKGPKTHEAFMKDIIKKSMIRLPKLAPGQNYVYDPETEKLMVEKPE